MIAHVLIPTDFSDNSYYAVKEGIRLADALDAKVTLIHTYEVPSSTGSLRSIEHYIFEDAEKSMKKLLNKLKEESLKTDNIETVLLKDNVIDGVNLYSSRHNVDLIILGNKGETNLGTTLFGSNAQNVIRNAKVAVMVISDQSDNLKEHDILLSIESLDQLEKVKTSTLRNIAYAEDSKLYIAHVKEEDDVAIDEDYKTKLLKEKFDGIKYEYVTLEGDDISDAIDQFAKANKVQLITYIYKKRSWLESIFDSSMLSKDIYTNQNFRLLFLREAYA